MTSCLCLDVATLNSRTEQGSTSKFQLYSGQGLYFSYSAAGKVSILLWGADTW